ncbi:hypothetical protein PBI_PERCIVAL_67 [Microbacterium phage Percival]|uniref:Uncharacterized protein n=1 Tax=Microbacterium phage Percival TaxID=2201439 RepID=A0A2Z4Q8B0_9CAUD|nr:hypothetical protein PBI_PERCIVAL_67 [Microbacterium phage Percival]
MTQPKPPAPKRLWEATTPGYNHVSILRNGHATRPYTLHANDYRDRVALSLSISDLRALHKALSDLFTPTP